MQDAAVYFTVLDRQHSQAMAQIYAASFPTAWPEGSIADLFDLFGTWAVGVWQQQPGGAATEAMAAPPTINPLVAPAGHGLIGFIMMRLIAGEAEVITIAIDPAHRGQQIATRLLMAVIEKIRPHTQVIFLEVAVDNPIAQHLYEKIGFRRFSLRVGYYHRQGQAPVDAIMMRYDLA